MEREHILTQDLTSKPNTHDVDTTTPDYKAFERTHDTYLNIVGMNMVLLAGVVAVLSHLIIILTNQTEFSYNTFADILQGPLLFIIIAGLTGVGLLFGHYGVPEKLYYALYIPFGMIVIAFGIWSMVDRDVDKFEAGSFSGLLNFNTETLVWLGIALVIIISAVMTWASGEMRLDALGSGSIGTFVFVSIVMLFTYGLSNIFTLLIRTLEHSGIGFESGGRDSNEFALLYMLFSVVMIVIVVSSIKFMDTLVTLFAGHYNTVFIPPFRIGAAGAVMETQRAYKYALYLTVFITSALIWRRRNGIVFVPKEGEDPNTSITREWMSLGLTLILIPVAAFLSEAIKPYINKYTGFYDLVRANIFGAILVFVGTGYIPWNFHFLGAVGLFVLFLGLQFIENPRKSTVPMTALICAAMFVMGKFLFRAGKTWLDTKSIESGTDPDERSKVTDVWLWFINIIVPALILVLLSSMGSNTGVKIFKVYLAFCIFYSFTLTFIDRTSELPLNDDPEYDIVPENEAASLAIDGLLLIATLMITSALWNAVFFPKSNIDLTIYDQRITLALVDMVGYLVMGIGSTYLFINIRHDHVLSAFARKSQKETEEWFLKGVKTIQ